MRVCGTETASSSADLAHCHSKPTTGSFKARLKLVPPRSSASQLKARLGVTEEQCDDGVQMCHFLSKPQAFTMAGHWLSSTGT